MDLFQSTFWIHLRVTHHLNSLSWKIQVFSSNISRREYLLQMLTTSVHSKLHRNIPYFITPPNSLSRNALILFTVNKYIHFHVASSDAQNEVFSHIYPFPWRLVLQYSVFQTWACAFTCKTIPWILNATTHFIHSLCMTRSSRISHAQRTQQIWISALNWIEPSRARDFAHSLHTASPFQNWRYSSCAVTQNTRFQSVEIKYFWFCPIPLILPCIALLNMRFVKSANLAVP